jgi:hypothetical protein
MTSDFPRAPFTTAAARSLGLTPRRLAEGVRRGEILPLFRGVYARTDIELTTGRRATAASLVVSPHAIACDRTAAWIWGVDSFELREQDTPPPLELFTLRGHRAIERTRVRGGQRDLHPQDWVEVGCIRVTTPVRTALDLGCGLNRRAALATMDALARSQGISSTLLAAHLNRFAGRRGVVQLRDLVPLVDPRSESHGESWMRLLMHDHGLPAPVPQHWVEIDGVPTYRLDLAYPLAKIAIEYDGRAFHSSAAQRARDSERRGALHRLGWTVIIVNSESLSDEASARWIAEVREALATAQSPQRRWYARV